MPQGSRRIDQVLPCRGALWDRLLEPFLLAALNTDAKSGSASLAGAVIRESLARGGDAYRPRIAHPTLAAAFVEPALAFLAARGAVTQFGQPVRSLNFEGDRLTAFHTSEGETTLGSGDGAILATPPWISQSLVPGLTAPDAFRAIVNGHFRFSPPPGVAPIVGLIGGVAQWIFAFPDRLSVTVSAADGLVDQDREALARQFWAEIAKVHDLPETLPPYRIVKERRATFRTPAGQAPRRPGATSRSPATGPGPAFPPP
jgi:hypothetical protein